MAFKALPPETRDAIRAYASDRVTCRSHEAALISGLTFRPSETHEFYGDQLPSTVVEAHGAVFLQRRFASSTIGAHLRQIRLLHGQYDERNFPQHFGLALIWPNLREQDETEEMGAEDMRRALFT